MDARQAFFSILVWALLTGAAAPPPLPPNANLDPGEHQAIVNDVRLWYRVAGRPGGVPVVFLHGGPGQGSQSFAKLMGPHLEPLHRMVYLDQRGSGRSERPWTKAYSLDIVVDDLERLRQAWGVPRIAIIGHSVGSMLAMEYGAKYPDRVTGMVLAASGPDIPAAFNGQCDRLAKADPAAYARAVGDVKPGSQLKCNVYAGALKGGLQAFVNGNMFPDPTVAKLVEREDNANGLRNTGEYSKVMIDGGLLEYRFAQPRRLTMPVLVVAGEKDYQTGTGPQKAFAQALPKGRFLEYAGAGHFMFVEQPERFARDVTAFLQEAGRRVRSR